MTSSREIKFLWHHKLVVGALSFMEGESKHLLSKKLNGSKNPAPCENWPMQKELHWSLINCILSL